MTTATTGSADNSGYPTPAVSVPEAIEIRDGQIYRWRSAPVPVPQFAHWL